MSQNCDIQSCQWFEVKRIKSHFRKRKLWKMFGAPLYYLRIRRVARIWKREGYFERVKKVQTTLTRIFIVLESVSHDLSENSDEISRKARKFQGFFHPKSGGLLKNKFFTEIETNFSAKFENSSVWGGLFSYGGAIFNFSQKIGLKSIENVRFCILHKPMGKTRAPPPPPPAPPWLRYCLG